MPHTIIPPPRIPNGIPQRHVRHEGLSAARGWARARSCARATTLNNQQTVVITLKRPEIIFRTNRKICIVLNTDVAQGNVWLRPWSSGQLG